MVTLLVSLVVVLLVVGTVKLTYDAMTGCPFALVWLLLGGIGKSWELIGELVAGLLNGLSE